MSEDKPVPPVRLWWWLEDNMPGLLPVERRFFRAWDSVLHPRAHWYYWRKWRSRPGLGAQVEDCRSEIHTVTAIGDNQDDLTFEDGHKASWMNCCNWPEH
jgi:hypothetical protein